MIGITKYELDPADYDILLASDLMDDEGNFYAIDFKTALDEILEDEKLIACKYTVATVTEDDEITKRLLNFIGWTETKVIFNVTGLFYEDSLLSWVMRHPSDKCKARLLK